MANDIIVRYALKGDIPAILGIYNDVIINTTAVYSDEPHTLAMRAAWYQERMAHNFPVYVAQKEDKILGFSSYGHFRAWSCYRYTAEVSVYVDAPARGKGISKLLLNALIKRANKSGIHALIAGISADNEISINLHRSFGFEEVAHFKEVGFKFGRWLDLKFMELLLADNSG